MDDHNNIRFILDISTEDKVLAENSKSMSVAQASADEAVLVNLQAAAPGLVRPFDVAGVGPQCHPEGPGSPFAREVLSNFNYREGISLAVFVFGPLQKGSYTLDSADAG